MFKYIATAAFGVEAAVKREVARLPDVKNITALEGHVYFEGEEQILAAANLNLRCADRVLLVLKEFEAADFDSLYEGVRSIDWAAFIPKNGKFTVDGKSVNSTLTSVPACQKVVKKAAADSLMASYNMTWLNETFSQFSIALSLRRNIATITLDTSGTPLHKRGYRLKANDAPLKETLAAALLDYSFYSGDKVLIDPFCGSGTIAIEAAMRAKNIASGINRTFIAEEWGCFDEKIWRQERERAKDNEIRTLPSAPIFASDISKNAIALSIDNAKNAQIRDCITFTKSPFSDLDFSVFGGERRKIMVTNPPYAERIGEISEVKQIYRDMGTRLKKGDIDVNVLTAFDGFLKLYGVKGKVKMRKLYNGGIESFLYQLPAQFIQSSSPSK